MEYICAASTSKYTDNRGSVIVQRDCFQTFQRELIFGFDVGSYGMRVGETRKLCIPAAEGYGPNGKPPTVPGDATLLFDLECLSVG